MASLFYQTVHAVNSKDYTQEQLDAWAAGHVDLNEWNRSFLSHDTLVAFVNGKITGFGDMDGGGYLDRLYVHKDRQRQGIASAICDALESRAASACFTTHASITARPFFEKRGYVIIKEQQVARNGQLLTNYVMQKEKGTNQP